MAAHAYLRLTALSERSLAPALRVAVASADRFARAGLTALIEPFRDLTVVGELAVDGLLSSRLRVLAPDVMLIDGTPPALNEIECPTVLLVGNGARASSIFAVGARGVLLRTSSPETIHAALHAVANGLVVADRDIAPAAMKSNGDAGELLEPLSHRELEVMQHLAAGLTNREIGTILGITEHTVKFHVNAILSKLGVETRTQAVVHAVRLGIVVI